MKRYPLPDLMKGLAVVLMVQVHILELFARQEIYDSTAGKVSLFLGGPFAAPVFIAVMGYFLAASRRSFQSTVWRGVKLLILGLALNIGLNFHLLLKIYQGSLPGNPWQYILGVDILFVAGFSVIIIAFLKKIFRENILPYVILMVIIPFITGFIPREIGTRGWVTYAGSFVWLRTSWSYFPLLPWMAYPLAGFTWFLMMKKWPRVLDLYSKRKWAFIGTTAILLLVTARYPFSVITELEEYYHHNILVFIWILVFTGFLMMVLNEAEREWGSTGLFSYLKWTGKEVTVFYVIQWLIVGNLATALYKTQYPLWLVVWFAGILGASSILAYFYSFLKKRIVT